MKKLSLLLPCVTLFTSLIAFSDLIEIVTADFTQRANPSDLLIVLVGGLPKTVRADQLQVGDILDDLYDVDSAVLDIRTIREDDIPVVEIDFEAQDAEGGNQIIFFAPPELLGLPLFLGVPNPSST